MRKLTFDVEKDHSSSTQWHHDGRAAQQQQQDVQRGETYSIEMKGGVSYSNDI